LNFSICKKQASLSSKHKGQPRGERREPERTGERLECALRRVYERSERGRQGQTGVRQGIAIPARTKRQYNVLPCLIQEIAESPGEIERERGRRLNLYFSDGSTNDGLDRNPAGLRLLFCY